MVLMARILRYFECERVTGCRPPKPEEISMKRWIAVAVLLALTCFAASGVEVETRFLGVSSFALAFLALALLASGMLISGPRPH
jgi:hypothetical protein